MKTRDGLLNSVAAFWTHNSQFHLIVLDKLLQYRLVEASDIISWIFSEDKDGKRKEWSSFDTWTAFITVVRNLESRVEASKLKLEHAKVALKERLVEVDKFVKPVAVEEDKGAPSSFPLPYMLWLTLP